MKNSVKLPSSMAIREVFPDSSIILEAKISNLRVFERLAAIIGLVGTSDWQQEQNSILADAERALKRAAKRAEALPDEFERIEVVQQRGPRIEFVGRLLSEQEWVTRGSDPMKVAFEIWETQGGALVAISSTEPADRVGIEIVKAIVVERQDDVLAMRLAVMDFFDFHDRARTMARKIGWDLRVEVE